MKFQLINLIYFLFILTLVSSKHRTHKYSCPITKKCPVHKHKICGSDGKLYDSHCHLRKASCDRGVTLRAVHPDQCDSNDDNNIESTVVEDCEPKQYDLMKQQLLQKAGNDASLLFTQLDENNDGSININELWRKSAFYRPADNSPCILTDLLQHEDKNQDDFLDFNEFQNSFNNLYTITMVTLDQSLAVNTIQAHIGDNVEIRCDIVGNPQQPVIKWHRHNVDLSTISIPNVKVFSDGSLYLTNVQVPLSGNYTCSAENNPVIKQTHILHVIVPPIVEVTPHFQWSAVGGKASIDCQYESLDEKLDVSWFKNNEIIEPNERTSLTSNRTRLTMSQLSRSDTGAYSCRVTNRGDAALGQDTTSLLVQDEPVGSSPNIKYKQKLWVFHSSGVSVFTEGCSGLLHEMDARDTIPLNGQPLCGSLALRGEPCSWSENGVIVNSKIYIGQPELNRIIVFHIQQLNVIHIIATDPRPTSLWLVRGETEDRIWILNYGQKEFSEPQRRKNVAGGSSDSQGEMKSSLLSTDTVDSSSPDADAVAAASAVETAADEDGDIDIDKYIKDNFRGSWDLSSSREQQKHNRKTVQIIRISQGGQNHNVIHLQPIDGHFDLVYNLFIPQPSTITLHHSVDNARYAYVTHWDERTLVKIDMEQFRYVKTINLADCQPINAVFTDYGLVILQCQTPVTHQLNGQLIIDQLTDSIISYNAHIKSHRTFLSPNHQFLVNIFHNSSTTSPVSTTIIVQKVTANGLEFLYDVRTTLSIVNCDFVWKNGNYDALLASGTLNREDLLYLSLVDGRVELISGIGRPTKGSHRSMAVSRISRTGAITSAESVFIIDLNSNMVQCETQEHRQEPSILMWT